jgi:hypothetical protein
MSFGFAQAAEATQASISNTIAATFGSAVANADTVVGIFVNGNNQPLTSVADDKGNTFTILDTVMTRSICTFIRGT